MDIITKTVKRTLRERLAGPLGQFWVKTKQVRDYEAERLRDMVRNRPSIMPFEMRSSTSRTRVPPRAPVTSSYVRHSAETPISHTDDNFLTGAMVGYMVGSHGTAAPATAAFSSSGGGDFGGGGASGSWNSSADSCRSSDSAASSYSSSDSGSCSSSD